MSFNIDDPLAGILSDGSDDSFFDDDILGKKKPPKKIATPTAERKHSLFNIDSEKLRGPNKSDIESKNDSLIDIVKNDDKSTEFDAPNKSQVSRDSIKIEAKKPGLDKSEFIKSPSKAKLSSSHNTLDILGELGVGKKEATKPLEKGKSSQSVLDDILGGSSKTVSSQATRPTTAAKSQEFDFDSILGKSSSKQTVSNVNVKSKHTDKIDNTKESLPSKKKPAEDWLGIFQDKNEGIEENEDDGADMPTWLVGSDTKKKKSVNIKKATVQQALEETPKNIEKIEEPQETNVNVNLENSKVPRVSTPSMLHAGTEDITTEGAALYLQQQESQLMIALQLKAQEEKLAALQMRQKESQRVQREAELAHHAQLDSMLQRQSAHRQQMQAIISAHQERITQRIKALLGTTNVEDNPNEPEDIQDTTQTERKETAHMKEKRQLLQLVQSLQENHDKEIDLMETSYRRQLAFLEISLSQSEERMKEESDKLVKYYSEKINWLEEHHQLFKKLTENNINALTERHKVENELLREQHLENIKILQEHHVALMENIKKAVKHEQALIQESAGFSSDLHELVRDVKENKSQCQILVEKVKEMADNTQKDTERSLQSREIQINDMMQQLKKEREDFVSEKVESREIVKMLENRLKQMTSIIEEDTASLKQRKMEFEFEKATFNKQTEFAKNVLKKQDEEIKILREEIQKEYEEKITKIEEEKKKTLKDSAIIAKEKASIHSIKQELETMKAELQAQLEEVTEERSKLNVEKQHMHMEEQRILAKSRDLDLLAKTAMDKQSHADKKYSEAEFLQRKYEERIRRIQEHAVSLNTREKQIAREKVALSRERLTLHNERKQLESRQQCSLCKTTQNITDYTYEPNYNMPDTFLNVSVSRDYGGAEVNSAMNAIEQEMAYLMSRNFNLRHSTSVKTDEKTFSENKSATGAGVENNLQPIQSDTGHLKDFMDPKLMMLRLDVQQVLSNLEQNKNDDEKVDKEEH
ncbi:fas-binding factor 1 homolog [Galleria mellonella]|uniref:Fas-binding factor 1 homolog n=1 Tax=Galleria mellonella TaxID=7137 RepID=A0A6J1X131_GALME|nr:fas-binding factor 1 homolog [Galleria mellonella]